MSSHHIVRDEQEPALLVIEARLLRIETVANLLEWSPTILVPYNQLDELTSLGYKPDVILGTSAEMKEIRSNQMPFFDAKLMEVDTEAGIVTAALKFLLAGSHKAANILSAPSQFSWAQIAAFLKSIDVVFYSEEGRWIWCRNGIYRKWLSSNSPVVIYQGERGSDFQLTGFQTADISGQPSTLLTCTDGIVTITSRSPFLLKEPL